MQKGMKEYYDYLKKESDQNNALLSTIKQQKGKTFFKYLMEIINNSDGIKGAAEIIKEPIGDFQKESYGRQIKGIWVDQRSVGDSGDSWEGTVCVQLGESRYFKFGYSM
jgi:predicted transcriptional regulator